MYKKKKKTREREALRLVCTVHAYISSFTLITHQRILVCKNSYIVTQAIHN